MSFDRGSPLLCAWLAAGALGGVLWTRPAVAEEPVADPVAAALFRKGRELVAQGDWKGGCEKFRMSLARYASPSTVLNLARCEERDGKLASAWALHQRALVLNRETQGEKRKRALEEIAKKGIAALEPRLPRLRVIVSNAPAGLTVTESGQPLPRGEPVPLDPGTREVVVSAPGHVTLRREVSLEEGKVTELEVELEREVEQEVEPPKKEPVTPKARDVAPAPAADRPPRTDRAEGVPTWAWVAGGAGIVATGVAGFFAADAASASSELERICGSDLVCDEDPTFDPTPLNSRKNRGIGLAVGFGTAGLFALGASIVAIVNSSSSTDQARVAPWMSRRRVGARWTF